MSVVFRIPSKAALCLLLLSFFVGVNAQDAQVGAGSASEEFTIDGIGAVVFGKEGTQLVTKSELVRPGLAGSMRSLADIVFERQIYLDALAHKLLVDDDVVDRYLAVVQRQNNLTSDELRQVFASAGYTFDEGREQFKMMQVVNQMVDYQIRSNLVVPRKDVEAYYEEHPEVEEATYTLQHLVVPFESGISEEEQQQVLEQCVVLSSCGREFSWPDAFTVRADDIAPSRDFIKTMSVGEYHGPIKTEMGFEIYHLADKQEERKRTLDERYHEIVEQLREPKFNELITDYRDKLNRESAVVFF